MDKFTCGRNFIESISRTVQRNVLIAEYCDGKFQYVPLVDVYYRKIDSNAIFMFLLICIGFPIFFMAISAVAEKYLSVGMQDLSKRFKLSPALAATTLIAFANGAPDVLAAFTSGDKAGAAFISIGALFGAFIFNSTMVIANILWTVNTEIVLSKWAVLKEIFFYGLAVLVILIFGIVKTSGYPLVVVYLSIYAVYIYCTLQVDRMDAKEKAKLEALEGSDVEAAQAKALDDGAPKDDMKVEEAGEGETSKSPLGALTAEVIDDEAGLFQNAVLLPLKAAGLIAIPYLDNPLMKTHMRFLINAIAIAFIMFILEIWSGSFGVLCLFAGVVAAVLETLHVFNVRRTWLETTYEIIAVFSAIAFIKIFSTLIMDCITFLAFYFSISEVVLATLLLSVCNCLGDFFGNAALAIQGETVMAAMAAYSGQIFNVYLGLSMNVLKARSNGNVEFDIYGQNSRSADGSMHPENKFVIFVACYVVFILALNAFYYTSNKFVLRRKFGTMLFGVYGVFFAASIIFALRFRTAQ